jgi:hypothetical protein
VQSHLSNITLTTYALVGLHSERAQVVFYFMIQKKLFDDYHPQIENKKINSKYYGSNLNQLVAEKCRIDMVVNNIDLIINDYKNNSIRIIESKHNKEQLTKGQKLLLKRLSSKGINTYVVYGDYPYESAIIYSFQTGKSLQVNKETLIKFLNNEDISN